MTKTETEDDISLTEACQAVKSLLLHIGEDPERDGLVDTPSRVVKAWAEMTAGYAEDPGEILARTFNVDCDEIVILKGISFYSTCEHHLLPFYGEASIGYLPGKVVGISKLARLVNCFSRRLQVQERLTQQIAHAIEVHLECRGVGVVVEAHHMCMGCRGVRQPGARMITSAMCGAFRTHPDARAEFLHLIRDR